MNAITVHTQPELDQAIADEIPTIYIDSPAGVWLRIFDLGSSRAELRGSSRAELRGSSRAVLWDSSRAVLRDSSRAVLRDSSRAVLRDSSRAVLWDFSRAVLLWGSSRAVLWDSSSAELRGSSSAVLWGSSRAVLRDSSRAELRDSSRAVLRDSSRAELRDSSRAETSKYTVAFLYSQRATLTGSGHLIDLTELDLTDPAQWCDYHGVAVADGIAYLYKAVDEDWKSGYGTDYSPGSTPEAPDWSTRRECGGGLHLCAHPSLTLPYLNSPGDQARFLRCGVRLDEMVCLDDKVKVKRVVVGCVEVDWFGDIVEEVTA